MALVLSTFIAIGVCAVAFAAEPFPNRPMRIIVPYAPGGGADVPVRIVTKEMARILKQPIIVENHPGAGGNIGVAEGAQRAPDGYTMIVVSPGQSVISFLLGQSKLNYKDFAPIGLIMTTPITLSVLGASPFKSLGELITYAKYHPNKLTYSSGGLGSITQLAGRLLQQLAGVELTEVPYSGDATTLPDFLAGRVDVSTASLPPLLPYVQNGQVRTLVIMGPLPATKLPGVPTAAEAGFPKLIAGAWLGLEAPANTPLAVRETLNAALNAALKAAPVQESFRNENYIPQEESIDSFRQFTEDEYRKWGAVVSALNLGRR
jgi:tripartite-type tricarboxylate transporter receptor subunit TctC